MHGLLYPSLLDLHLFGDLVRRRKDVKMRLHDVAPSGVHNPLVHILRIAPGSFLPFLRGDFLSPTHFVPGYLTTSFESVVRID